MIICHGQPSWRIGTQYVDAYLTETGGHLAPVTFHLQGRKIQPFAIAPWASEQLDAETDEVLRPMRGDFFCLPFGGNAKPWRGKRFCPHGPSACRKWELKAKSQCSDVAVLEVFQKYPHGGEITKHLELRADHSIVYQRHTICGMSGSMPIGHHPIIQFPDEPGCGYISTSRTVFGQVYPSPVETPERRGYSSLKPGAEFTSLRRVPTLFGKKTDLSRYPARRGFEDIVLLASDPTLPFAWSAAAFPEQGYLYFSLKNPRQLASTLFWISNGGRHYAPWNGRHVNVMGMEEITAYFHDGLAESSTSNHLSRRGIPTAVKLTKKRPYHVCFIMGIAPIDRRFRYVKRIAPFKEGVKIIATDGQETYAKVDLSWLM